MFGRLSLHIATVLLAVFGLTACGPAPAPASSAPPAAGKLDLEQVERVWRGQPDDYARRLAGQAKALPPGSPDLLNTLSLQGLVACMQRDRAGADAAATRLRQWSDPAMVPSARLAAVLITADCPRQQGDLREARRQLGSASPEDRKLAQPIYRWRFLRAQTLAADEAAEFDKSMEYAQAEFRIAQDLGRSWRVALSLLSLANASQRADTMARAKQLASQALAEAQKDPDPVTLNAVHTNRGVIYADDPDTSIALQSYLDALEQATHAGSDRLRALALANLSDYQLRQGRFTKALETAQQALPLALATHYSSAEVVARANTGLAKIALGRIAEGREDVVVGLRIEEQQGSLPSAADGWEELARYLERFQDFKGAVQAQQEYRRVLELVQREDMHKVLLEAQERYDAEQRQRDIELLNRDNALKAEQLSERNLELGLWAALVGCVLVSVAVVVQALRKVQRTNQALAISNASLKRQSESDPLTGLANRRHFQSAMKTLAREGALEGSIFLIDVDHFKRINDGYGHAAGDRVLVDIAQRLRSAVRDDDLVVRWGGEEFLIVASTRDPGFARGLAQRLLDLIGGQVVEYEGAQIPVTASVGFVSLPLAPNGLRLRWERAIDLVDTVMYLAKSHGRNKAYGVERMSAQDDAAVAQLTNRLEAAWSEGTVGLLALQGPAQTRSIETGFQGFDSGRSA